MTRWKNFTPAVFAMCGALLVGCNESAEPSLAPNDAARTSRPAFLDQLATMNAPSSPLRPGEQLPEFVAEGWIHGGPVTRSALLGKIAVVEVWAYW